MIDRLPGAAYTCLLRLSEAGTQDGWMLFTAGDATATGPHDTAAGM
jgi:hypothetical protein